MLGTRLQKKNFCPNSHNNQKVAKLIILTGLYLVSYFPLALHLARMYRFSVAFLLPERKTHNQKNTEISSEDTEPVVRSQL